MSRYQDLGVPKRNAEFILSWTVGWLSRFMLHRAPMVTRHQIHLVLVMDSHQHLPLACERVTFTTLSWTPLLVCRGVRGCPLRALAVVSDCWLMARPSRMPLLPAGFGTRLLFLNFSHYSLSRCALHSSANGPSLFMFFIACRENHSAQAHTVPVERNASVTDIGIRSAQSIITSSWGLFVYTIHLIFSSVSWELCPILILSWKDLHCRGPVCATEHVLFDAVCVSEVCFCFFWTAFSENGVFISFDNS